jgi:beta-galactosidase GanA
VIPWNLHEPQPGSYVFQDMLDINAFLTMAAEEDLYVLLRPGPYICAGKFFSSFIYPESAKLCESEIQL